MDEEKPLDETQNSPGPHTEDPSAKSGKEETVPQSESDSGVWSTKQTTIVVASIGVVVVLIIIGLFLPPISLGERLGLSGDEPESTAVQPTTTVAQESAEAETAAGEVTLNLTEGTGDVTVTSVSQQSIQNGDAGEEWAQAAAAIPPNLTPTSNLYAIEYEGDAPQGSADIAIPAEAQPLQTLDLYSWNGQVWTFTPSSVDSSGSKLTSHEGPLPLAFALMQTSAPSDPVIGAEVLPAHSLPAAVLPYLTEVTAGTLTLAQDGSLAGEIVSVPTGGYRQLVRATNSGAIVDTASLSTLLNDPAAEARNIQELTSAAANGDFAGVNLDYQGVTAEQRDAFTAFVGDLADALHAEELALIVTLETPVEIDGEWDTAGQDWPSLGQTADAIYAQMPLDPTVYGDSDAAEQLVLWATRQVDRSKLSMLNSVNAVDGVGDSHREVDSNEALANFGEITFVKGSEEVEPGEEIEVALSGSAGDLEWDASSLTYKYTYEMADQPHDVWLGSEAVLSHRSRFAVRYNLRGLAVRGLGTLDEGEGYAAAIQSYLGSADAPQPASAAIVWVVENESGGVVASDSGDSLVYAWEAAEEPGDYTIRADFAQGDSLASLGSLAVAVASAATPTPEPTEEPAEEATPTAAAVAQATNADPGDADAAANTPANVRNGPGLAYGIIGGVQPGEKVSLIGRNDDASWLQVTLADGSEGWIFASLLNVNANIDTGLLAVVEVDPPVVASGDGGGGGSAPPPVIAPAGGGSFELGGQTHTLANPTLMSMAGMNWVKFQHKWGPGDSPDGVAGRIQQAHGNGFKVLLSIPGSNAYPSSIDFGGYVEFLRGVAAFGPDAIEVWNEENIDFEWPAGQISPADYVNNMLAPAYNAIKSANPGVMVISGAPAPTGFDNGTNAWSDSRYMAGVAAAGGANYMDCIGVHHNAGATSPNAQSGHPAGNNHYSWYFWPTLNMYYNSFGGARPVCFTELGFLSGQDFGGVPSRFSWAANTTVAQHAQWLAEAASLSANSGRVRMMIIFNVDFTHWGDDPQAGYAMLRPDGSCPSCDLLRQVMGG